jgi:hypothetical protein
MTLDEARAILGVAARTPPREIRRSYLRQVRRHPPERDPEGFQRVRAAFELLSAGTAPRPMPPFEVPVAAWEAGWEPAGREPLDEPVGRDSLDEPAGREPLEEPVLQELSIGPAGRDPVVADVTRRLEELSEEISDEHFEVLAKAVEEHPDRPQLFWLWIELLEDAGRDDEIPDVLRWGAEHRHPGFFEALVARSPQTLTPEEMGRAVDGDDPRMALIAAQELVRRGEPDSVVEIALGALNAWTRRFPDQPPPVGRSLEIFFVLQVAGRLALARELLRGIEGVVDDFGIGLDRRAVVWLTAAQELVLLPADFPRGLRAKLAESTLEEDREIAADAMHEFALEFPSTAPDVAEKLRTAPHSYGFYGHLLAGRQSSSYSPSPLGFGIGGILLFLLFQLLSGDVETRDSMPRGYPPLAAGDRSIQAELSLNGMDFLLTWNCRHIANATLQKSMRTVCQDRGYVLPTLCTPIELTEVPRDE